MKILHLVLKSVWYDKIASGEKTSEYREIKPYWNKLFDLHILNRNWYRRVVFHRGYSNETMEFEIKDIQMTDRPNDLQLPTVWEIKLGRRIR